MYLKFHRENILISLAQTKHEYKIKFEKYAEPQICIL